MTDVGGTYNQGTGAGGTDRYTASGGTPFSATVIGEYVSVYTAGATVCTFVGQVTAINSGGASIDISLTIIYGTRPGNASTKTAKTGGTWNSFGAPAGLGATNVPQSTEIDVKQATYTLSAPLTLALAGLTTAPLWYRGYHATVGDLEPGNAAWAAGNNAAAGLSYPSISAAANLVLFNGAQMLMSGISFTGTASPVVESNAIYQTFYHCRFASTSSSSYVFLINANATAFICCWFSVPAGANQMVYCGDNAVLLGCWFAGAGSGTTQNGIDHAGGSLVVQGCTFYNVGKFGVTEHSGFHTVYTGNTFYKSLNDAINISALATSGNYAIIGNAFFQSGGYDINNSSGANTDRVLMAGNLSYSPTSGHLAGFGDWAELYPLVDGSQSYVSTTDLHLKSTSLGAGAGLPQQWENI